MVYGMCKVAEYLALSVLGQLHFRGPGLIELLGVNSADVQAPSSERRTSPRALGVCAADTGFATNTPSAPKPYTTKRMESSTLQQKSKAELERTCRGGLKAA